MAELRELAEQVLEDAQEIVHGVVEENAHALGEDSATETVKQKLIFLCSFCAREFSNQRALSTHFSKMHKKNRGHTIDNQDIVDLIEESRLETVPNLRSMAEQDSESTYEVEIDGDNCNESASDEELLHSDDDEVAVPLELEPFEEALRNVSNVILDRGNHSIHLTELSKFALKFCHMAVKNGLSMAVQNDR